MTAPAFVIVIPNAMAFRAVVKSDILKTLKKQVTGEVIVLSHTSDELGGLPDWVQWRDIKSPCKTPATQSLWRRALRFLSIRVSQLGMGYGNIAYRFNQRHQFRAHQFKQKMGAARQEREEIAGNFVNPKYGRPFANSALLYQIIYRFFYAKWQIADRHIERFFEETKIEAMALWYVQNPLFRDYSICMRKYGVDGIGVIGSWDRLTTKGPICPGCTRYIVNSEIMKRELTQFHEVDERRIHVVGWPQMDIYKNNHAIQARADFFARFGLPEESKLVVFAGNSERLGQHEPDIVEYLGRQVEEGVYGDDVYLMVRTHPNDIRWQERYAGVNDMSRVILVSAGMGDFELLANTLHHCNIAIATQGSFTLDAVAFDRCIVNIGFDGNRQCAPEDSVSRLYEMDHYRPVIQSGGVSLVLSYDELTTQVADYLREPEIDAQGRKRLREEQLLPFDGNSSKRQVQAMLGQ